MTHARRQNAQNHAAAAADPHAAPRWHTWQTVGGVGGGNHRRLAGHRSDGANPPPTGTPPHPHPTCIPVHTTTERDRTCVRRTCVRSPRQPTLTNVNQRRPTWGVGGGRGGTQPHPELLHTASPYSFSITKTYAHTNPHHHAQPTREHTPHLSSQKHGTRPRYRSLVVSMHVRRTPIRGMAKPQRRIAGSTCDRRSHSAYHPARHGHRIFGGAHRQLTTDPPGKAQGPSELDGRKRSVKSIGQKYRSKGTSEIGSLFGICHVPASWSSSAMRSLKR